MIPRTDGTIVESTMTILAPRAELYFRAYVLTTLPLHAALIDEMCARAGPPLELATVLEDIGQQYMAMADQLNRALIERGRLAEEPDPEHGMEAQIEQFVTRLVGRAGRIRLTDGREVDGGSALAQSAVALDAIRTALLTAPPVRKAARGRSRS